MTETESNISSFRSGAELDTMYLALFDKYDQLVRSGYNDPLIITAIDDTGV